MRVNKFIAASTSLSRRAADTAIANGRVRINDQVAQLGSNVALDDQVTLDGQPVTKRAVTQTIILHKPVGYVCSKAGQGSKTIYELLPNELWHLKPVGRLDKDSSGLLVMTDDGQLANQLTHPSYQKDKTYEISLDRGLEAQDFEQITNLGVKLDDGLSKLRLSYINDNGAQLRVVMHEGRNRQIRRTFEALDYRVMVLHRTEFGPYNLGPLPAGKYQAVK